MSTDPLARRRTLGSLFACLLLPWCVPASAVADHASLTLHVEDAMGYPGGRIAFVIRAYASRPIGQGQLCFAARPRAEVPRDGEGDTTTETPLLAPTESIVFSQAGDAEVELAPTEDEPRRFVLRFVSPSASVNVYAGPLAVVFFELRDELVPGAEYDLVLDSNDTQMIDDRGDNLRIEAIDGTLSIRQPAEPHRLHARAAGAAPGEIASIGLYSFEPVRWAAGRVALRYDPQVVAGPPIVLIDPRHGRAEFTYDVPTAGLLLVEFTSHDASLNQVPGAVVEVYAALSRRARPLTHSAVSLDPALTWIVGADGRLVPLELAGTELPVLIPASETGRRHAAPDSALAFGYVAGD
ncbi:MAG TPA: hypothetical protein VD788_06140 [Candidatus Polarisedimenticolaceae bacterium]|nr:hypothetical protein [Candidatus Polarisedimenticolaceae bacterium]